MDKKQVLQIIQSIESIYNNHFTKNVLPSEQKNKIKNVVETWYEFLKDHEYEEVKGNLKFHVNHSKFAPSIAELINKPDYEKASGPAVPSYEETQEMLKQREKNKAEAASPEVVEQELANIRKILGIRDDACGNTGTN
jgi:hypothetical protein